MREFDGQTVVVTGAAEGIGRSTAERFCARGATVVLGDIDQDKGRAVAEALRGKGLRAEYRWADVRQTASTQALIEGAFQATGRLDVVVNNAAVAIPGSAAEVSEADWSRTLETNLSGVWRGMRFALPLMVQAGRGCIINISSIQGLLGFNGWAAYAAAKGGVNALTVQAAVEYAPHGIRINALAPGTIMTPMNEKILADAEEPQTVLEGWHQLHALQRLGQPADIAEAALFLASERASFITGVVLRVDGGAVVKG